MDPRGPGASINNLNRANPGYQQGVDALTEGARLGIPEKDLIDLARKHYDNPEQLAREIRNYDDD